MPMRSRRGGSDVLANIMSKVLPEPNSGCWLWTGCDNTFGYGLIRIPGGKLKTAHRVLYELLRGPVAKELDLDHLCRVRCCVNPDHLEPVSRSENLKRGAGGQKLVEWARTHPHWTAVRKAA